MTSNWLDWLWLIGMFALIGYAIAYMLVWPAAIAGLGSLLYLFIRGI